MCSSTFKHRLVNILSFRIPLCLDDEATAFSSDISSSLKHFLFFQFYLFHCVFYVLFQVSLFYLAGATYWLIVIMRYYCFSFEFSVNIFRFADRIASHTVVDFSLEQSLKVPTKVTFSVKSHCFEYFKAYFANSNLMLVNK